MHSFTQEDLILHLYKEISADQSALLNDALATDWALREKYEVIAAAVSDLEKLSLSPRKVAVDKILEYAAHAPKEQPTSV